jgi:hypothetical protein
MTIHSAVLKVSKNPNSGSRKFKHNSSSPFENSQTDVAMLYRTCPIEELSAQVDWMFVRIWTSPFLMSRRTKGTNAHLNMPFPITSRTFMVSDCGIFYLLEDWRLTCQYSNE